MAPIASVGQADDSDRHAELSKNIKWIKLLHYKKRGSGFESDAVNSDFFLTPQGRTHPQAELEAMVTELTRAPSEIRGDQSPVCRFPARTLWLANQLGLKIPPVDCKRYLKFKKSLSASGVSLIFSSYYLNNPSSSFGHTFLRLRRSTEVKDSERAELLDYGINYAADVTSTNAVFYALAGAFGWFQGSFTKMPYYYKIREYSDYESRDLWSYDLNLTQEQVNELVNHIWELGSASFKYYFFSANCSYQILEALEVVNPDWNLSDRLDHVVIPAETVKVLWNTPGLVKAVDYRPSSRKIFETQIQLLSSNEKESFDDLIERKKPEFPPSASVETRKAVLDTVIDYYDYKYAQDVIAENSERAKERQDFLVARSELGIRSSDLVITPPLDKQPHLGHATSRFYLMAGYASQQKEFFELNYRGAFHDLLDPREGYPDYAQIEILDASLRVFTHSPKVELHHLNLVKDSSLTPLQSHSYPLSWRVQVGAERLSEQDCPDCMAGKLLLGGGATLEPAKGLIDTYLLANVQGNWATRFPNSKLRLGIGPTLGLRFQFLSHLALVSEGNLFYFVSFSPNTQLSEKTEMRFTPSVNYAIGAYHAITSFQTELGAAYYVYF